MRHSIKSVFWVFHFNKSKAFWNARQLSTNYKANIEKGLKKDKNIVKLIEADEKGELEKWIKDNSVTK